MSLIILVDRLKMGKRAVPSVEVHRLFVCLFVLLFWGRDSG